MRCPCCNRRLVPGDEIKICPECNRKVGANCCGNYLAGRCMDCANEIAMRPLPGMLIGGVNQPGIDDDPIRLIKN